MSSKLLSKLLGIRGIEKEEDLSPEEKATIDRYKLILSGRNLTVDSLKEFCKAQIRLIEERFATGMNPDKQDNFLRASLHVYITLLKAIEAPEAEREALERHLNQIISNEESK